MDRNSKTDLHFSANIGMDKAERLPANNGNYIHNGHSLFSNKMGEIAKSLLNIFGWTAGFFAFLANLPNPISLILGVGSAMFIYYKALEKREVMLIKRIERKEKEYNFNKKINSPFKK